MCCAGCAELKIDEKCKESSLFSYIVRLAQEQCGKVNCVRPDMILTFVRGLKTAIKHINEKKKKNKNTLTNVRLNEINMFKPTNAEKLRNLQANQHICKSLH